MKRLFYALLVKKALVFLLMAAMLVHQQPSYSQALPVQPVANFVVNRAIGGVITKVAAARGFAANDARIAATMVGASNAMTAVNTVSTVAGIGLAVAGAPVWLTVAAGLGVLAVGAAIVAGTSTISIKPTSTGNALEVSSPTSTFQQPYTPPASTPVDYFGNIVGYGWEIYRDANCFPSQPCYAFPSLPPSEIPIQWRPYSSPDAGPVVVVFWSLDQLRNQWTPHSVPPGTWFDGHWYTPTNLSYISHTSGPDWEVSTVSKRLVGSIEIYFQDSSTAPNIRQNWNSDSAGFTFGPNFGPKLYSDLQQAYNTASPTLTSQQVSHDTLARIVDAAWQRAAQQPGYEGLPYSVMNPVTAADVMPWAMENPMAVPTVGDLLTPANNPGTQTVPVSPTVTPGTSPNPNPNPTPTPDPTIGTNVNVVNTPNVNVTNQVKVDLGENPNIGSPGLESTPTAQMILQPLLDLFPSLRNFAVPAHTGECPKPSFDVFGKSIVMESHCTLTESVRPTLYAVMAAVWLVLGLVIVLAA